MYQVLVTLLPITILFLALLCSLFLYKTGKFSFIVSLGNDLFGLLSCEISILLGEISYSIYLLHGIILYIIVNVVNPVVYSEISYLEYLMVFIPLLTMLLISSSAFIYLFIEKTCISYGRKYVFSNAWEQSIKRKISQ